jgi:hypothetical protein
VHIKARLLCIEICSIGKVICENVMVASPHFITGALKDQYMHWTARNVVQLNLMAARGSVENSAVGKYPDISPRIIGVWGAYRNALFSVQLLNSIDYT